MTASFEILLLTAAAALVGVALLAPRAALVAGARLCAVLAPAALASPFLPGLGAGVAAALTVALVATLGAAVLGFASRYMRGDARYGTFSRR
ncbi:MAG: hypothetical protein ACU85V_06695, partial [Gammaproteobacteria bacterium]